MLRAFLIILIAICVIPQQIESSEGKFPNGSCPLGSFPCTSTDDCIPQANWCDEIVHCLDSSDEMSCVDVYSNDVINQKHRKRPGAEADELPQYCYFQPHDASPPPLLPSPNANYSTNSKGCECIQDNIICRHLHLTVAPSVQDMFKMSSTTQINLLDLGGNEFQQTSMKTFAHLQDVRIRTIVLQHCSIKEFNGEPFEHLLVNGLENLHLDGNRLRNLDANVFNVQNNNLRLLSIGHNSISTIDDSAFVWLKDLVELDLRYNHIEQLNAQWFLNLYSLQTLHLQGNLLTRLDTTAWPSLLLTALSSSAKSLSDIRERSIEAHLHAEDEVGRATRLREDDVVELENSAQLVGLQHLNMLSLAGNRIRWMADATFASSPMARSLINLDLSDNRLEYITNMTFKGLSELHVLMLNQNALLVIDDDAFAWMPNLTSLDLQSNERVPLNPNIFFNLKQLEHLYFDSFEQCANAPLVKDCQPKGDGISTKENLLDSIILRGSVWIMALIGFAGNLIVLLGRQFITKHTNVVDSLHIKNLAISDLLMSVYLFAIAAVDQHYRGEYLIHERVWRRSNLCTLSGFLNTLSCESSVLILSLITWDRYVSVTRPFPRNQMSFKFVALRLVALWIIAIGTAALPVLHQTHDYFGNEFYNANGVCLPLYLHNPYGKGWQYSVVLFVFVNLTALAFISYAYLRMIHEIRVSTVACRSTQQTQERDRVAQHLGIIVFTDCLCWVPIIAIKMATLSGFELNRTYRNFVYASLAIYIMPINSALNPILYTFATPLFKKQVRKLMHICCQRQKRPEVHSGYDTAMSLSLGMLGSNSKRLLTYRGTQTSHTGSKSSSWRKQPQPV